MENKKLLKFLYKDIAEIEEIFAEKGRNGFDNFEIEFIQSRFVGAKQIIQILSEKENQFMKKTGQWAKQREELDDEVPSPVIPGISADDEFVTEEETAGSSEGSENEELAKESGAIAENVSSDASEIEDRVIEHEEEPSEGPVKNELEMDESEEPIAGGQRLGDSFLKEKSVNDLMSGENNKLEYKISNSPVTSIQAAIGINDRYQYIRELFDGSSERYSEAVSDLDKMGSIQEAVAYLQLNYKWKKTETSLKFVNLVKRRFANG